MEGFNNKTLKVMEYSIKILPPLFYEKKPSVLQTFYLIMFMITKFGENFEEKIDICSLKMFGTTNGSQKV